MEFPTVATIGLLLIACLAAAGAYLLIRGRNLGAVIVIVYSVVGLLLVGAWWALIGSLDLGPAG